MGLLDDFGKEETKAPSSQWLNDMQSDDWADKMGDKMPDMEAFDDEMAKGMKAL